VQRPAADSNVRLLYRATFLFGLACGISIALTSLHLDASGYTKQNIGSLAVWFASGIVLMSLPAGALIRRFSAKRTLLACMAGYSICVAAFPFLPSYASIAFVRFFDGASSVGIWVASETILLSRTKNEHKAYFTSLYAIWLASGYVLGAVVADRITAAMPMRFGFVVSGVVALAAAALLAARLERDAPEQPSSPSPAARVSAEGEGAPADAPAPSLAILWRIKTSCFATYAYGYFQASVVLFLPLYLIESKGIARERTIILPGLFSLGMLLFSNPAGRVADRIGHLLVMRALGAVGTLMILGFVFLDSYVLMCAAVFVAGSTLASMSPVSLALQGVVTEKQNYTRSNAIYNVFYASGMLMGPPLSSAIFSAYGGKAMLYHLAALYAAFLVFSVVFMKDDPAVARRARAAAL
jgi:MFS family permease